MKKNLLLLLAGFVIAGFSLGCAGVETADVSTVAAVIPDVAYLKSVNFDSGKDSISADAAAILKENATYLNLNSNINIVVEGHSDSQGNSSENQALGKRRAEKVKSYYVNQLKIASKRISTVSFGQDKPVDTSDNESAWAKNRRADTKVVIK
jgi:peptidoglycan-associated lipoprotein